MRFRNLILIPSAILLTALLAWLIVIPESVIKDRIEEAAARPDSGISLSVDGLSKGLLFSLNAGRLTLAVQERPALFIDNVSANPSLSSLSKGKFMVQIESMISGGTASGEVSLHGEGQIIIDDVQLSELPVIKRTGLKITGRAYADISMNQGKTTVTFKVPDLSIGDKTFSALPFISSFRSIQGAASVSGNNIVLQSVSLDGIKGHARLKGSIINGIMDLALEIMPDMKSLTPLESMMIGKYIVSPGRYVIPVKGPLP